MKHPPKLPTMRRGRCGVVEVVLGHKGGESHVNCALHVVVVLIHLLLLGLLLWEGRLRALAVKLQRVALALWDS